VGCPGWFPRARAAGSPSPEDHQVPQSSENKAQTKSQDSENGFPRRLDPRDRTNSSKKSGFYKLVPPKGRPHRRKEIFKQIRILKIDCPEREAPQTERACINKSRHPQSSPDTQHTSPDHSQYKSRHPTYKTRKNQVVGSTTDNLKYQHRF